MPLIQSPNIGRKLQRALRLTELPDGVLAPEVVPVIVVEDLSLPLTDIDRGCVGTTGLGAVAAEFPILVLVRVGAPATYDLTVTRIWFSSTSAAHQVSIMMPTAGVGGATIEGNTSFRSMSIPGRPSSQMLFDNVAAIPAARRLMTFTVLPNSPLVLDVDYRIGTIGDGRDFTSIMIAGRTVNTDLIGGFEWTESPAEG